MDTKLTFSFPLEVDFNERVLYFFIIDSKGILSGLHIFFKAKCQAIFICISIHPLWQSKNIHQRLTLWKNFIQRFCKCRRATRNFLGQKSFHGIRVLINILATPYGRKALRVKRCFFLSWKLWKSHEKCNPQMPTIRAFFPKLGALLFNF